MGTTLRYPYELRDSSEYFGDIPDIKIKGEMLELAQHIVESKTTDFDPSKFVDHYEQAVIEMLRQKQAGMPPPKERVDTPPTNVINLMDALRRSLGDGKPASTKAPAKEPAKPSGRKRAAAAKEEELRRSPQFKLPIKGGKEQPAKRAAAPAPAAAAGKSSNRRKTA
jgi:DNA end-binding protein Ku